jgi:hypothetical protein
MTGKNLEHIQTLAENVFSKSQENIMNQIMDGTFNLDDFIESQEHNIRDELHDNWEGLVGEGNAYWERDSISDSDLKFLMGRLKHELCLKLPEIIKRDLKVKYQSWQLQYIETLTQVKDLTVNLCQKENVGSSRELMDLQSTTSSLHLIASLIDKVRLFFTAQQLKIDRVAIPVVTIPSDLEIKAIEETDLFNGNAEIAAAASTPAPAAESPIESVPSENNTANVSSTTTGDSDSESESEIGSVHIFERSPVNGFVNTVKHKPALVPESTIREKGFDHGDKLRVLNVRPFGDRMHYDFELVEKGSSSASNRVQFNLCIVEKDDNGLFVQKAEIGQTKIVIDGTERKLYLLEKDITRLKIVPEDIIDIAFKPNNSEYVRVAWKHYL